MTNEQILKNHFKLVWYDEDQQDSMTEIYFCKSCNRDFDSKILALKHYREFKGKCKSLSKNTNKQILKKCIEKALKNNWKPFNNNLPQYLILVYEGLEKFGDRVCYDILFDHSFAKAFWGDACWTGGDLGVHHTWQYHIMNLAKSTDRLKYMEQFIKE